MSITLRTKCAIMRLSRLRLTDNLSFITGHHYYDWVDLYESGVLGILPSSCSFLDPIIQWNAMPMMIISMLQKLCTIHSNTNKELRNVTNILLIICRDNVFYSIEYQFPSLFIITLIILGWFIYAMEYIESSINFFRTNARPLCTLGLALTDL